MCHWFESWTTRYFLSVTWRLPTTAWFRSLIMKIKITSVVYKPSKGVLWLGNTLLRTWVLPRSPCQLLTFLKESVKNRSNWDIQPNGWEQVRPKPLPLARYCTTPISTIQVLSYKNVIQGVCVVYRHPLLHLRKLYEDSGNLFCIHFPNKIARSLLKRNTR